MSKPRIHLISPAGPCRSFLEHEAIGSFTQMVALVGEAVGSEYAVTACEALFDIEEDPSIGGRTDDAERIADFENALEDPNTCAIVAIRGGAWLMRLVPKINFDLLNKRSNPVALFGFSEITSLVNIVASYEMGRGIYDDSPAFLVYGLRHYAQTRASKEELAGLVPRAWMREHLVPVFQKHFQDIVSMIEGKGSSRKLVAKLVSGEIDDGSSAGFAGGNLTVFPPLMASKHKDRMSLEGKFIVLEDYNDRVSRLDRMLSMLTMAGTWDQCAGIVLGDFHVDMDQQTQSVLACLPNHLPKGWNKPILITEQVGHIYPMSPLPLQVPVTFHANGGSQFELKFPPNAIKTI